MQKSEIQEKLNHLKLAAEKIWQERKGAVFAAAGVGLLVLAIVALNSSNAAPAVLAKDFPPAFVPTVSDSAPNDAPRSTTLFLPQVSKNAAVTQPPSFDLGPGVAMINQIPGNCDSLRQLGVSWFHELSRKRRAGPVEVKQSLNSGEEATGSARGSSQLRPD